MRNSYVVMQSLWASTDFLRKFNKKSKLSQCHFSEAQTGTVLEVQVEISEQQLRKKLK